MRRRPRWLVWLAVLVWLIPLGFLFSGFWPFFLFPALAITLWAYLSVKPQCPRCHHDAHTD